MSSLSTFTYPELPPKSFFTIPEVVYASLDFQPDAIDIKQELASQADEHDIICYWVPDSCRLVGIFPHQGNTCYFAHWEGLNHPEAHKYAFDQFEAEAKGRGFDQILGPYHFNTFGRYRLRLQTPVWTHFDREPANPEYYVQLLENQGYKAGMRYESRLVRTSDVPDYYIDKASLMASLDAVPYDFIPLTPEYWAAHEQEIYELILAVFGDNPGFQALPFEAYQKLYNPDFARRLCLHTSIVLRDQEKGELAAISLCHPNYKPLQLPPKEQPDYARHYALLEKRTLLAKSQGVHPNHRQQGLMSYLGAYGMLSFKQYYDECLFCLMREGNFSLQFTEGLSYASCEYALFEKKL